MKEVRGLLVIHLPSNIFHQTSSDCTGGRAAMQFDTASQNNRLKYISNIDINKIRSALQSLKEERAHIEKYLQNAAARKKELDKELKATFDK